jgi:hypothetical protein
MMRRTLIPLPRMYPRQPSSTHIFLRLGQTPLYVWTVCELWTCLEDQSSRQSESDQHGSFWARGAAESGR